MSLNKDADLNGIVTFLCKVENLKNTKRSAWTSSGKQESTAEHTWRLTLLAMLLSPKLFNLNMNRVIHLCIIHDVAECITGDISAKCGSYLKANKTRNEEKALHILTESLNKNTKQYIQQLWFEYNEGVTEESRIAKALDKLETILQHTQGVNPLDFDYSFNLNYGKSLTDEFDVTKELRDIIDQKTIKLITNSQN